MIVCSKLNGSGYDRIAEKYDQFFGLDNPYYGPITNRERELFDLYVPEAKTGDRALDIGCGTGLHTEWLTEKGYSTVGVDISKQMLHVAKRKSRFKTPRPTFIEADALTLDRSDVSKGRFQIIVCLGSTLNHFSDWRRLTRVVSNLLTPKGVFVFSYDNLIDIDSLRWLIPGRAERQRKDMLRRFNRIVRAIIRRRKFQNHWRIVTDRGTVEIPLTYESTFQHRKYLDSSRLKLISLSGVHVMTRLSQRVVLASNVRTELDQKSIDNQMTRLLSYFDNLVSKNLPSFSANVVGVARKIIEKQE